MHAGDNLYGFFQETAGKQTVIRVGPNADGSGCARCHRGAGRERIGLRHLDWIEGNRRKVDGSAAASSAYVYLPDTAEGGFTNFNRYYFSQIDKQGAVIDERYNHGGQLADYIVDYLRRKPMSRRDDPRRRDLHRADAGDLRAQGDAHQPVLRLRRRRAAVVFQAQARSARWSASAPGAAWSASAAIRP